MSIPNRNSEGKRQTTIKIGEKINLACVYEDAKVGEKITFYVFRENEADNIHRHKKYEGQIDRPGVFISTDYFEPKLKDFGLKEDEIIYTFDVEYKGKKISCRKQLLKFEKKFLLPKIVYQFDKAGKKLNSRDLDANAIRSIPTNNVHGWTFSRLGTNMRVDIESMFLVEYEIGFRTLILAATAGSYFSVGQEMANHFIKGGGTNYQHTALNKALNENIRPYLEKEILPALHNQLKTLDGDISKVVPIKPKNRPHPFAFNKQGDFALGVLINDYISIEITVVEYDIGGKGFSGIPYEGTLKITVKDDFNLDNTDMVSGIATKYIGLFQHWFVLQRYTGITASAKPFWTDITTEVKFRGDLLSNTPSRLNSGYES